MPAERRLKLADLVERFATLKPDESSHFCPAGRLHWRCLVPMSLDGRRSPAQLLAPEQRSSSATRLPPPTGNCPSRRAGG
jgi:hypothetical protein